MTSKREKTWEGVRNARWMMTGLIVLAVLLGITAWVEAKGGTKLDAVFESGNGEAILGDGAGPYEASLSGRWSLFSLNTDSRALWLDFTGLQYGPGDTPFGGASSGYLTNVKIDGAGWTLEFNAPAPDGSGNTPWLLDLQRTSYVQIDLDGDGVTDVIENSGTADTLRWWDGSKHQGPGGRGGRGAASGWTLAGSYTMPWKITATVR